MNKLKIIVTILLLPLLMFAGGITGLLNVFQSNEQTPFAELFKKERKTILWSLGAFLVGGILLFLQIRSIIKGTFF